MDEYARAVEAVLFASAEPLTSEEIALHVGDCAPGDSINVNARNQLTMQTPGATSVEAVDLKDLVNFARMFDVASPNALRQLAEFATSLMTGVGTANLLSRVETIQSGRARTPATPAEAAAVAFVASPSNTTTINLLQSLADQHGARVYRPEVLHCCISALRATGGEGGFIGAAIQARERNRHLGRPLGRRGGKTCHAFASDADQAVTGFDAPIAGGAVMNFTAAVFELHDSLP